MDPAKIKLIFFGIVAVFAAVYLGVTSASAQFEAIAWVVGSLALIGCVLMGSRIWLLIPFMAAVDISLRIPGQPNTLLIAQIIVLVFSVVLFLMRKLPFKVRLSELEILILTLIAVVAQTYMRNPVGISLFGTDSVGGKSYILFAITCVSSFLLCFIRVSQSDLISFYRISLFGCIINFVVGVIGHFIPIVGFYTGAFYSASSVQTGVDSGAAGRISFLGTASRNLSLWISSMISPVMAVFRPQWLLLILAAMAAAAFSGYRSSLIVMVTIFLVGTIYRGGGVHVILGLFGGFAAVFMLSFANLIHPFPPNIQRALTFLPGTWEERYKEDAEGSTDWRTEVWKDVLLTDRWIQNKYFGDGLGFSAAELKAQISAKDNRIGVSGFDAHRENILASGDYHSTAVSAVRTCGYLGLFVLIVVMFRLAVHAHRLIRRCRGTPWFPLSIFLGIPPIVALVNFPISASNFLQVASAMLLSLSLIRLAENNIDLSNPVS